MAYIDQKAAVYAIKEVIGNLDHECKPMMDFYSALWNVPAADVAPVRHGRWELDRYGGVICSECKACCSIGGKTAIHNAKSSQHFCFNCGVKMD